VSTLPAPALDRPGTTPASAVMHFIHRRRWEYSGNGGEEGCYTPGFCWDTFLNSNNPVGGGGYGGVPGASPAPPLIAFISRTERALFNFMGSLLKGIHRASCLELPAILPHLGHEPGDSPASAVKHFLTQRECAGNDGKRRVTARVSYNCQDSI